MFVRNQYLYVAEGGSVSLECEVRRRSIASLLCIYILQSTGTRKVSKCEVYGKSELEWSDHKKQNPLYKSEIDHSSGIRQPST